jgi:hypothetical protein
MMKVKVMAMLTSVKHFVIPRSLMSLSLQALSASLRPGRGKDYPPLPSFGG